MLNKKLKIAIYSGNIPSTTFIENLIKGIAIKHTVLLFGKQKSKPNYTEKIIQCYPIYANKFQNLLITKWRTFLLLLKHPKRFKILWQQLKQVQGLSAKFNWWSRYTPVLLYLPDIFHIQWAKDVEKWIFLKEKLHVKVVLSLRGAHINYSPIANKELAASYRNDFPKVDAFHAVSEAIGLEVQKYGAAANKIKVIHSLISKDTFEFFQKPRDRDDGILRILSVGRHHWKKGYTTALDACKLLKEKQIPFTYTIVAGGSIPEELIFQRNQLGLIEEITFNDAMLQEAIFEKMKESDVLLLPSLEEGIANVVLEAMAIGLPVVSTDCGGMKEVVIPKKTGWLVPVLNSQETSEALIEVSNLPFVIKKEIVTNAFNFIKKSFNCNKGIQQFVNFYVEI